VSDSGNQGDQPLSHRRLEERAVREAWPLPAAVRVAILKRLVGYLDPETVEGSLAEPRTVIQAARTILAADRLNVDRERLDLAREALDRRHPPDDGSDDGDYVIDLCPEQLPAPEPPTEAAEGQPLD
jgi:hypothetical protein